MAKSKELQVSEGKLEKVEDSLKGQTEVFRKKLEVKQKELEPVSLSLNASRSNAHTCETEINLIQSKSADAMQKVMESKEQLINLKSSLGVHDKEIKDMVLDKCMTPAERFDKFPKISKSAINRGHALLFE